MEPDKVILVRVRLPGATSALPWSQVPCWYMYDIRGTGYRTSTRTCTRMHRSGGTAVLVSSCCTGSDRSTRIRAYQQSSMKQRNHPKKNKPKHCSRCIDHHR
eukprot:scaffold615839_cov14-Prasinocladus_malaysianus.AAC.1